MKRNPPAFPRPHSWDESSVTGIHEGDRPEAHGAQDGMSLRDYFAARQVNRRIMDAIRTAINFRMFNREDIADVFVVVVCIVGLIIALAVAR